MRVLLLLLAALLEASGTFSGSVYDPQGAAIPNATVTLTKSDDATTKVTTITSKTGEFQIAKLPRGHYYLDVSCNGYAGLHVEDIEIQTVQPATLNVMLPQLSGPLTSAQISQEAPGDGSQQYRIGTIQFTGYYKNHSEAFLRAALGLESGEMFQESRFNDGIKNLKNMFGAQGFINFKAVPVMDFNQPGKLVNIRIAIDEDRRFFVRHIDLNNRTLVTDQVIRTQILLSEGHLFNAMFWDLSLARLEQLGYFDKTRDSFAIKISPDQPTVDIELTLSGNTPQVEPR